jgi:hypothetical protein
MNGMLAGSLVAFAFGIAVAHAMSTTRHVAMIAFVLVAEIAALVPIPSGWNASVNFACWIAIVACGSSLHFPKARGARVAVALAVVAAAAGGAAVHLANARTTGWLLPVIPMTTCALSEIAARRVPLAPKVVSSWLIAIALLAATLQLLPVTPGYLPDHLE